MDLIEKLCFLFFCSIICILFLALAVVVKFGMRLANLSGPWPPAEVHLWPHPVGQDSALNNVITCFNYLSLTMVCQFNILPLQRELRKPTRLRLGLVNVITLLLALMIYVVVGIFGYLTVSISGNSSFDISPAKETSLTNSRCLN